MSADHIRAVADSARKLRRLNLAARHLELPGRGPQAESARARIDEHIGAVKAARAEHAANLRAARKAGHSVQEIATAASHGPSVVRLVVGQPARQATQLELPGWRRVAKSAFGVEHDVVSKSDRDRDRKRSTGAQLATVGTGGAVGFGGLAVNRAGKARREKAEIEHWRAASAADPQHQGKRILAAFTEAAGTPKIATYTKDAKIARRFAAGSAGLAVGGAVTYAHNRRRVK